MCVQGLARAAGEEQREFSELVVLTFPQKSDLLSLTCIYRSSLNSRAHSRGARAARITYTYASEVCSHASMFVCVCTYMERVSECEDACVRVYAREDSRREAISIAEDWRWRLLITRLHVARLKIVT